MPVKPEDRENVGAGNLNMEILYCRSFTRLLFFSLRSHVITCRHVHGSTGSQLETLRSTRHRTFGFISRRDKGAVAPAKMNGNVSRNYPAAILPGDKFSFDDVPPRPRIFSGREVGRRSITVTRINYFWENSTQLSRNNGRRRSSSNLDNLLHANLSIHSFDAQCTRSPDTPRNTNAPTHSNFKHPFHARPPFCYFCFLISENSPIFSTI